MACARPIIASNIEDLEFIETQGIGVLFAPGDIQDFTEKLQSILNLPEDKKRVIGECARHLVEENYSWDAVVQSVRQFVISGSTNNKTRVPVDVD
jgi:glycosyltransferase involved in cell wall biosynthesis